MEIVGSHEIWRWDEKTDDGEFSHTAVAAVDQAGKVYFTKVQDRLPHIKSADEYQWSAIPTAHIYPILSPGLTIFKSEVDDSIYHKKPCFMSYDGHPDLAEILLKEAEIYQLLQEHKSPFIAQYHGCIVSNNRIVGLALTKYGQTLDERMKQPFGPIEAKKWLDQLHEGIGVIHQNGLAHNDLSPWNVMIDNENAVIIDFDSCCSLGEELIKCGTPDWSDHSAQVSAIANDTYSLQKIATALGVLTDTETTSHLNDHDC